MLNPDPDTRVPHTEPVLDNDFENAIREGRIKGETSSSSSKIIHAYRDIQLSSILRNINKRPVGFATDIVHKTWSTLRRLGLKRDIKLAVVDDKIEGSDNFEMAQFRNWCDTISKDDEDSLSQLVVIDATARIKVVNSE